MHKLRILRRTPGTDSFALLGSIFELIQPPCQIVRGGWFAFSPLCFVFSLLPPPYSVACWAPPWEWGFQRANSDTPGRWLK